MTSTFRTWSVFVVCLSVVVAVLNWISLTALDLERAEAVAAAQSENERLALWRMESAIVPLVAHESSRQPSEYHVLHTPAKLLHPKGKGQSPEKPGIDEPIQIVSPLLAEQSPYLLIHFQFEPGGSLTSPQVPDTETSQFLTASNWTTLDRIETYADRLRQLSANGDLLDLSPGAVAANGVPRQVLHVVEDPPDANSSGNSFPNAPPQLAPPQLPPQAGNSAVDPLSQQREQPQDRQQRSRQQGPLQQAAVPQGQLSQATSTNTLQANEFANSAFVVPNLMLQNSRSRNEYEQRSRINQTANGGNTDFQLPLPDAALTAMQPVWREDALLLVRRARVDGMEYVQGCLLDWPAIQVWLEGEIADLLPQARLVATAPDEADPQSLRLASLPVRLVPGNAPFAMQKVWTPLRLSLVLAWIGAGLAALAIAVLLWKSMQLSERRAVFVSAVTHELRTPLTTFRMYTDILAGGRLTDEAKKQRYLDTLRTEAERLGHLVENVLSYARLEKTREERVCERVELSRLFARVSEALEQRVTQSGMRLMIETPPDDGGQVTGDAGAIERILFNLVDNACKYANDGSDQPIRVICARHGNKVQIAVEDGGPGMPRGNTEKLFRPFCKSAHDAAKSAPGVGLGLSLCRRLARKMNGNLRVDPEFADGARVVLELPFAA